MAVTKANFTVLVEKRIQRIRENWFNNPDFDVTEKEHQIQGMRWAIEKELGVYFNPKTNSYIPQKKCGFICDEMGLGKTTVILGTWVGNYADGQKTLVVVPPALLNQWYEKIQDWLGFTPYKYHGHLGKVSKEELLSKLEETPIVLTTYSMVSTRGSKKKTPSKAAKGKSAYHSLLWDIEWTRVIYDESHHLRNEKSNKHQGAKKVKSEIVWLLTGTPIQNRNNDLYSQLKIMGIFEEFLDKSQIEKVEFLYPYVKLRTKESIGLKLPPLTVETINITDYDSPQEKIIIAYIHSLLNFTNVIVTKNNVENQILNFLNTDSPLPMLTRARQSCVCPGIIKTYLDTEYRRGNIPNSVDKLVVKTHTKIRKITEKIAEEKKAGNRVLVFCHYVQEMDMLKTILTEKGVEVEMLNGKTTIKQRRIIPKLSPDALIVQVQSCCEGLNLQQFSTVIFTSPHWNPAVEDQAIARAHRIGQEKPVKVFRYICSGLGKTTVTLDQYCMAVQDAKRELMNEFKDKSVNKLRSKSVEVSGQVPE